MSFAVGERLPLFLINFACFWVGVVYSKVSVDQVGVNRTVAIKKNRKNHMIFSGLKDILGCLWTIKW